MITRSAGVKALLAAVLLIAVPIGGAEAKREVNLDCKWFGTAPFCKGRCPAGWTQTARHIRGEGQQCITGSKVRCCDFRDHCVPEFDPSYHPDAKRIKSDGTVECQQCDRFGEDCKVGGPPRFNTACAHYKWVVCGHTTPPPPKPCKGCTPGPTHPVIVPDDKPQPPPGPPPCVDPHVLYKNGVCGCPSGLKGADCTEIDVR